MSKTQVKTPLWVQALLDKNLTAVEYRVWQYLFWRQGNNRTAWPSQRTIGNDLGLTADGVRKITLRLEAKGWLRIQKPEHHGRGHLLQYTATQQPLRPQTAGDLSTSGSQTTVGPFNAEDPDSRLRKTPTAVRNNTYRERLHTTAAKAKTNTLTYDWSAYAFTGIPGDQVPQWTDAYPGIDVLAEIRRAAVWCRDNERRARQKSDWPRFLGNWLAKAQRDADTAGRAKPEPQRGDPDWLPTEEEARAALRQCEMEAI